MAFLLIYYSRGAVLAKNSKDSKEMKSTLVVLTLNEIEGMRKIMPRVKKGWVDEMILADGGSTDGTREYAKELGMRVVDQKTKGRGEAFRVGAAAAKNEILVYFSPDGNEDPNDIPKLIDKIREGYDMAIASRFSSKSISEDATLIRRIGNNIFTFVINILFGIWITDAVNGYRAVRKTVMKDLKTDANRFEIEIQMTMRCARKGYKITEIPTFEGQRIGGQAKLSTLKDGWAYTKLILREFFRRG